jgi:hypothetical protein
MKRQIDITPVESEFTTKPKWYYEPIETHGFKSYTYKGEAFATQEEAIKAADEWALYMGWDDYTLSFDDE